MAELVNPPADGMESMGVGCWEGAVSVQIMTVNTADGPILVEAEFGVLPEAVADLPNPDDIVKTIERIVAAVHAGLAKVAPNEFTVETGLKLTGETGKLPAWIIGKSTAEATIKLTAKWVNPKAAPPAAPADPKPASKRKSSSRR